MQRPRILLLTYSGHDASVDVLTFVELQPSSIYIYMVPECLPPQMAYGDSAVCPVSPTLHTDTVPPIHHHQHFWVISCLLLSPVFVCGLFKVCESLHCNISPSPISQSRPRFKWDQSTLERCEAICRRSVRELSRAEQRGFCQNVFTLPS